MTQTLTKAQAAVLERVQREGTTVFDGRKRSAVYALQALGLVTVTDRHWYIAREKRGGTSYEVELVGEAS